MPRPCCHEQTVAAKLLLHSPMHDQDLPSPWFTRYASMVAAGARLLDVACGSGRHARFFAERGVQVTAVDRDTVALQSLTGVNGVAIEHRDIEADPWPYAPNSFNAVIVCNYLWRPTFDALLATLKPGGALLYETFMDGNERYGKPSRPDFLLRSNELIARAYPVFRVVAFAEGDELNASGESIAMKQKIAAIKLR